MVRTFIAALTAAGLIAVACAAPVYAEGAPGGVTEGQYRYDFKVVNGKLVKVDRLTGKVYEVNVENGEKERSEAGQNNKPNSRKGNEQPKPKRNTPPKIEGTNSDEDSEVLTPETPMAITDLHRRHAEADVQSYKGQIKIAQVVYVKDARVTGSINLKNAGNREIEDMELTLNVQTTGNGVAKFRFRLSNDPTVAVVARPPEPAPKGRSIPISVNLEAPPVPRNGKIYAEITYLRFAGR